MLATPKANSVQSGVALTTTSNELQASWHANLALVQ